MQCQSTDRHDLDDLPPESCLIMYDLNRGVAVDEVNLNEMG